MQLQKDGNNITEVNEIANALANNIVKNSSTENDSEKFKWHNDKSPTNRLKFQYIYPLKITSCSGTWEHVLILANKVGPYISHIRVGVFASGT